MKFGATPLAQATGAILAHAVKEGGVVLKKGHVLRAVDLARLAEAGVREVMTAQLEADDIAENAAAGMLAQHIAGVGIRLDMPTTGRCNLFAEHAGVLRIDAAAVDAVNGVDERITVASLPPYRAVAAGEMVGTVKIIPFAVPQQVLAAGIAAVTTPAIAVAPYRARNVAVISTLLPGLKTSVVTKTLEVMAGRLAPAKSQIIADMRVSHTVAALAGALGEAAAGPAELIVVFGASAITDREDVIPAAIVAAGGQVDHFGMPVDPGNLLLIGRLGDKVVVGAPGCSRSPRENGFDWVLQRLLADIPVRRADIQAMGVGGLLMEIVSRPQPRDTGHRGTQANVLDLPKVAVLVLAAGRSTRMGGPNKLLARHEGRALVRHVVDAAVAAELGEVIVVTGHQAGDVAAALAGSKVSLRQNPDFVAGLSTSLKTGIAAISAEAGAVIVMLGDMPLVSSHVLRRLVAVFAENPAALAVVPTTLGERGNPVLIARELFPAIAQLRGDTGARQLIEAAGARVIEMPVDDPGILHDVDTPEALARLTEG